MCIRDRAMTWPFENDTSNIEKKLAKRSLHHERQRNLFAIIALVLTAFMITATFSIGFSYFETCLLYTSLLKSAWGIG